MAKPDSGGKEPEKNEDGSYGLELGLCLGTLLGLVFGNALGNVGLGISLGPLFGLTIGTLIDATHKKQQKENGGADGTDGKN